MAMDEVVALADPSIGIQFGECTLDSIAYADDLIVFAESAATLGQKLARVDDALSMAGMSINLAKSSSVIIRGNKKQKLDDGGITVRDGCIRAIGPTDEFKNFGVKFDWQGRRPFKHREALARALQISPRPR